ncbi:2'-5' RNA ligase [Scopulibacillus darangshiensis]|uniref:Putative phosphoesterase EV207_16212 n=1 Tax=Scopulibacillus darangshiensis TaxID=442528 RepID=A0A4R2NE66_9BACL|nr:YjcG family protein [Scopulibacillus darangshiensis]TCP19507.1 2'-5' RNA ligase [Scopulibacillus darangshiensis]
MKYGVAMFPSKELQDKANSLRKRYDPHYALIPPHITLKSPFEVEEDQVEDVISKIKEVAKSTEPVTIKVNKVGSFSPINSVIYFKVEPTDQVIDLYKKLHSDNLEGNEDYTFVPHVTIAQNLTDEEHSDVLGSLKMKDIHHEEVIDRFQILYQLENESWTVYETCHLEGNN